jgi:aspartate/methionine/tyrosine aminotransferase
MTKDDFLEVNRIAQERGIVLFSDEVYRECEYSSADCLPSACDISERVAARTLPGKWFCLNHGDASLPLTAQ